MRYSDKRGGSPSARFETHRFEWSALLAVALLFAAISPAFAASPALAVSALTMSPAFTSPAAALSAAQPKTCDAIGRWFQTSAAAKPSASMGRSFADFAVTGAAAHGIESPRFAPLSTLFNTATKPARPRIDFSTQRPSALFASLEFHKAASLAGVRNNRFHE